MKNISQIAVWADDKKYLLNDKQEVDCGAFLLKAERAEVSCGTEYTLRIQARQAVPLNRIDLVFSFSESFCREKLLFFNNGFCTNDFAFITEIGSDAVVSRDLLLYQNERGQNFNLAVTTAERFLTRFISTGEGTVLRYYMEDKFLVPGEEYRLEQFVVDECMEGGAFFAAYASFMAQKHHIVLPKSIDSGWSSWSCYYGNVTEDRVLLQSENMKREFSALGADLIQIDDGWQRESTFSSDWTANENTFGGGIQKLSQKLNSTGQRLGLWLAPTLMVNTSSFFKQHYDYNIFYGDTIKRAFGGNQVLASEGDGSVYPLDLEKTEVLKHIAHAFENAVENFNCRYFKIDFLVRSLIRANTEEDVVTYAKDYCVAVYKNAVRQIRRTVGQDVYLLACGAPITETVGVFDSIRASQDITWCKGNLEHPGYWQLIVKNAQNIFLRSYYHNKVFINDPDALLVRDYLGEKDDDFCTTLDEARVWATVVAMSGGPVLINEEIERLSDERKELIRQVLPPIGVGLVPENFFEYPLCSRVQVTCGDARIAAAFNWTEETIDQNLCLEEPAFAFDCWSKSFLGRFEKEIPLNAMAPHSVRALYLKKASKVPQFLCDDANFYMGMKTVKAVWEGTDLCLENARGNVYVYCPESWTCEHGESVAVLEEGQVFKLPAAACVSFKRG